MDNLPNCLYERFMNGKHVVCLRDGDFNGVWTDMGIESTYMKVGKGNALLNILQKTNT